MGQQANSGRQADLDDSKLRAQGRQQNDPARRQILDREDMPPVGGASGGDDRDHPQGVPATGAVGGMGGAGGAGDMTDVGQSTRPAKKSKD
ncbi:MAG TPA: hypothetical protein VEA69_01690 [Tepidisphaeraceae bacterium]|nr:hypothetical protein [Tepidisphaeraceae bacterium]